MTGLLLPALNDYTAVIRPFLMTLLFFSFLGVRLSGDLFHRRQVYVSLCMAPIGLLSYYLGQLYAEDLGLTLMLMGIAPTAVITPVLVDIMRGKTEYAVGSILVTSGAFALIVPLILPNLLGIELSVGELAKLILNIGGTILLPLILAQLLKRASPILSSRIRRLSPFVFVLFLINVAVAAGSLSHYLRYESDTPLFFIWVTVGAIVLLMLVNFTIGFLLAPRGLAVEGSLALGRKNTMLSIWIALEYINPLTVLGPMLYILAQNVFVAGQISWVEHKRKRATTRERR